MTNFQIEQGAGEKNMKFETINIDLWERQEEIALLMEKLHLFAVNTDKLSAPRFSFVLPSGRTLFLTLGLDPALALPAFVLTEINQPNGEEKILEISNFEYSKNGLKKLESFLAENKNSDSDFMNTVAILKKKFNENNSNLSSGQRAAVRRVWKDITGEELGKKSQKPRYGKYGNGYPEDMLNEDVVIKLKHELSGKAVELARVMAVIDAAPRYAQIKQKKDRLAQAAEAS
jgi:hypothetical protein